MNKNKPIISVITVVFNNVKFLEYTIKSVINQTYDNIEYIIIDGKSTDGTLNIIKKYKDKIAYWISEPDKGIYDAMNKGIDIANGDFVVFINSGDCFYKNTVLFQIVAKIDNMNIAYFGKAQVHFDNTLSLYPNISIDENNITSWLSKNLPNHQSIFFPKIFYKNEKYDLKYKIFGDSAYKYRVNELVGFNFINIIVCKFALGGVSSKFDSYKDIKLMIKETWMIGRRRKGLFHVLKRIFIYHVKYFLRLVLKEELFFSVIKNIKR